MSRQPDGRVHGLEFFERPVDGTERPLGVIRRAECRSPRGAIPPSHVRVVCLMTDYSVRCSCGEWGCDHATAAEFYFRTPRTPEQEPAA